LLDKQGRTVRDPDTRLRVSALAIPPAWEDVWISPDPLGHIQATGVDAAGRLQYRYHDAWHVQRARVKFADMEEFAAALPALRVKVADDLAASGMPRERVLAAMVRLLDRGFFRIGCEDYAVTNGSYGLATMLREHVTSDGDALVFDYPAKSGRRRLQQVVDADVAEVVRTLRRRRSGGEELFAFKDDRRWVDVRSDDVNAYLKQRIGLDASAKDFRTWGATVLCAVALGVAEAVPGRRTATIKRIQAQAIREVARYLGNTPAVCRASYVDPRVLDRHAAGDTIGAALKHLGEEPDAGPVPEAVERAVLRLLGRV
jgi:DNA topoisomerase IB